MTDASKSIASPQKNTRKKALGIFFFLLILMAILAGLYWFYFIKDYQTTEDAYVSGNQVMISSQIAGNVRQIKTWILCMREMCYLNWMTRIIN